MKAYQLRISVKRHRPAIWRRCVVPGGITYAQLSLILTEVMGIREVEDYNFAFYQRKFRLYEDWEKKPGMRKYNYSAGEASDFYIDEFLDLDDWFSFNCGGKWKLRVTVEKRFGGDAGQTGRTGQAERAELGGDAGQIGRTGQAKGSGLGGDAGRNGEGWQTGLAGETDRTGDMTRAPWVMEIRDLSPDGNAVDGADLISGINEKLKENYTVRYQGPAAIGKRRREILREQAAGLHGLTGWENPKNDPRKIKYCTGSCLQRVAEIYQEKYGDALTEDQEKLLSGEREVLFGRSLSGTLEQQEAYFRDPADRLSLPELLRWNSRETLIKLGRELEIPGFAWGENVPGKYPGSAAGNVLGSVPGNVLDSAPNNAAGNVLGDAPNKVLGSVPNNAAGNVLGNAPNNAAGKVLGDAPDNVLESVPDNAPGNSLDRKRLAEQIAGRLLDRDVMEQCFLALDEGTLGAWERVVCVGRRHKPSLDDRDALGRLYERHYLAIYDDDEVEVPPEVAALYQKINTPEFRERRRQAWWLLSCLEMQAVIHGVCPYSVVIRMYQKKPGYSLDPDAFARVFRDIPERSNPCVLQDDRVIARAALKGKAYVRLERLQDSWEFFIPEAEEIEDCSWHGYPSQSPYYQKLRRFLCETLGLPVYGAERALLELWGMIAWGYDTPRLISWMKERTQGAVEKTVWEEYGGMIDEVRMHTRSLRRRGWMPGEAG